MKKNKIALIINIIILVLEIYGLGKNIFIDHNPQLEYYTIDSNILALISSLVYIFLYKTKKNIVKDFRFVATNCLLLTFLIVIFVLAPMYDFNYKLLMFANNFFIFHTLVPILSIISYIVFEDRSNKEYLGLIFTIVYGIILIVLNILGVVTGPYPFLMIKSQSVISSILWGILIFSISYGIGLGINYLNKKNKRS